MDEQLRVLNAFRGRRWGGQVWAGIAQQNCITLSISLTTEEAQTLFNQLYDTLKSSNDDGGGSEGTEHENPVLQHSRV